MSRSTLISQMQKFHFGSKIVCADGEEGMLTHTIFDPTTRRMTHLGVKLGRFFGKTVYVPYDTVIAATGDAITLRITRAELAAASAAAPSGANLDSKTTVTRASAGGTGTLIRIVIHPKSGELSYLVAHHLRPGQDTFLREEYITGIASGQVTVTISDEALNALPPYRPDRELQQEVESILFDLTPLHIDMKGMNIRVLDSVLYLDGNISSGLRGDIVEDQVLGVPGLLEIKNHLIGDDRLAGNLALALGQDPRTHDLPIGVYPRLGEVRLSGSVHSGQQKATAEEITKNFPGVRSVANDLVVDPKADTLQVMSSTGFATDDKVPGKYVRHTQ